MTVYNMSLLARVELLNFGSNEFNLFQISSGFEFQCFLYPKIDYYKVKYDLKHICLEFEFKCLSFQFNNF
jgi:hypothetical protein